MKSIFAAAVFSLLVPLAPTAYSQSPALCAQCQETLDDIQQALNQRCESVPPSAELRRQPIYLFLSIFNEVSNGIDEAMRTRIYTAALDGMECDNLDAGVDAAQKMSRQVMAESSS